MGKTTNWDSGTRPVKSFVYGICKCTEKRQTNKRIIIRRVNLICFDSFDLSYSVQFFVYFKPIVTDFVFVHKSNLIDFSFLSILFLVLICNRNLIGYCFKHVFQFGNSLNPFNRIVFTRFFATINKNCDTENKHLIFDCIFVMKMKRKRKKW